MSVWQSMFPWRETLNGWKCLLVIWCAVALTKSILLPQVLGGPPVSAGGGAAGSSGAAGAMLSAFNFVSQRGAAPRSTAHFPAGAAEGMGSVPLRDL